MLLAVAVSGLVTVGVTVEVDAGGGVIVRVLGSVMVDERECECECLCFCSGSSQQPKKRPGVSQVSESDVVLVLVGVLWAVLAVELSQPPPNQPCLHVDVVETEAVMDAGTDNVLVGGSVVVVTVRFADSLHANQPGVKQVVVVYVVVTTG